MFSVRRGCFYGYTTWPGVIWYLGFRHLLMVRPEGLTVVTVDLMGRWWGPAAGDDEVAGLIRWQVGPLTPNCAPGQRQ